MVEIIILLTTNGIKVDLWQRSGLKKARKACDGNCAYCEYYWQEWDGDESGCKLDDFESEDAEE